jgi:hypothetical protein
MNKKTQEQKDAEEIQRQLSHQVESISIHVHWTRNHTAMAEAWVKYESGDAARLKARATGSGYEKLSSVVADILNRTLRGVLSPHTELPAGCQRGYFEGGIGMECYTDHQPPREGIMQHIGYSCTWKEFKNTDFIEIRKM